MIRADDADFRRLLLGSIAGYGLIAGLIAALPHPPVSTPVSLRFPPPRTATLLLPPPPPAAVPVEPKASNQVEPKASNQNEPKAPPSDLRPAPPKGGSIRPTSAPPAPEEVAARFGLLRLLRQGAARTTEHLPPLPATPTGQPLPSDPGASDSTSFRGGNSRIGISAREDVEALVRSMPAPSPGQPVEKRLARVESGLPAEDARGTIRSAEELGAILRSLDAWTRSAYSEALAEHSGLSGTITLEIEIAPSGSVVRCRVVRSGLGLAPLEARIAERFAGLRFSAVPQGADLVLYTLTFSPS